MSADVAVMYNQIKHDAREAIMRENPSLDPQLMLRQTAKFGIKNVMQAITFNKSILGKQLRAEIEKQCALDVAQEQRLQEQARLAEQRRGILRGLILLTAMAASQARAEQTKAETVDQQKDQLQKNATSQDAQHNTQTKYAIASYDAIIEQTQFILTDLAKEEATLSDKKADIEEQMQANAEKYDLFSNALDELDDLPEDLDDIENELDKFTKQIDKLTDDITNLYPEDTSQAPAEADRLSREILFNMQALYIKIAALNALKETNKNHYRTDDKGDLVACNAKQAEYTAPTGQKIVKKGDTLYLLDADEELTDKNMQAAKNNFERKKDSIVNIRTVVQENKVKENKFMFNRLDNVTQRLNENNAQQQVVKQQQTAARDERNQLKAGVKLAAAASLSHMQPRPEFTPAEQKEINAFRKQEQQQLNQFCELYNKKPVPKGGVSVKDFKLQISGYSPTVQNFLERQLVFGNQPGIATSAEYQFQPGSNIPTLKMNAFLKRMETFSGRDAYERNRGKDPEMKKAAAAENAFNNKNDAALEHVQQQAAQKTQEFKEDIPKEEEDKTPRNDWPPTPFNRGG